LEGEAKRLTTAPIPHICAQPSKTNILVWYYLMEGTPETAFEGGLYAGRIKFPEDFPFVPPRLEMWTPNGRFACKQSICTSMSEFHPESWSPIWGVESILVGLQSFMVEDQVAQGCIATSEQEKQRLAYDSYAYLVDNHRDILQLFPSMHDTITSVAKQRAVAIAQDGYHRASQ
jgi:ubiquitin-conjugating enzyme E2 J2